MPSDGCRLCQVALDIQAAAKAAGKKMCWKSHSMGCYLLLNVVDRLRWKGEDMQSLFGAVILDAPDVPTWFFRSMIKVNRVKKLGPGLRLRVLLLFESTLSNYQRGANLLSTSAGLVHPIDVAHAVFIPSQPTAGLQASFMWHSPKTKPY